METQRLDLPITGMSCAGCAARIEKELQSLPGVQEAQVNFATEKATLRYDETTLPLEQIIQKVEEIGYQVPLQRLTIPRGRYIACVISCS
jgi:Cu+-exporting ATPase